MITAGCTPISSHKVLGGWLLPNLTSDLILVSALLEGVSLGTGYPSYPLLADPGGHLESSCLILFLGHLYTTRVSK